MQDSPWGWIRAAVYLFATTSTAAAQLQVQGCAPLEQLVHHAAMVLKNQEPNDGEELFRLVTAHLRLGDRASARALLQERFAPKHLQPPELALAAFATMQRTTGEQLLQEAQRRALEAALQRAEHLPFASYHRAALQVHGRFCLAQLDAAQRRSEHVRIATHRLLALEGETWQPGRGHYRPIPCHGELLVPAAADGTLLKPLSYGMLLASGTRLERHLRNTLAAAHSQSKLRFQQPAELAELAELADLASLRLLAAAQIGDDAETARAFAEVVGMRSEDPIRTALQLDAAIQAVSGVRLAAGGGLDDSWLRMRPWLPENVPRIELRNLNAQRQRLTVMLQRHASNCNLLVEVRLQDANSTEQPLVITNRWQQFVTAIRPEQPTTCELPARQDSTREDGAPN